MILSSARVRNYKSISDSDLCFSDINVLVGRNNTGKSAFLRAISSFQFDEKGEYPISFGADSFDLNIIFHKIESLPSKWIRSLRLYLDSPDSICVNFSARKDGVINIRHNISKKPPIMLDPIPNIRDHCLFIKFFSERKVNIIDEVISKDLFDKISDDISSLASLISHILSQPSHPAYNFYVEKCHAILGFIIGNIITKGGQYPGFRLPNNRVIMLNEMGAGVRNISSIIAELSIANNKVFLIEELENDLHPSALRLLLDAIIEKSSKNQFFISTHSHVVLTHLASARNSKIFNFNNSPETYYTNTEIEDITNNMAKRKYALEDLGYHFSDYGLFNGWLIFEESSMEEIVREYLIKWFCPSLHGKIRTVSAGGADNTEKHFGELHRMYLYTHLHPMYKGYAWIILDGDDKGKRVKERLIEKFKEYSEDNFICLQESVLEMYYPYQVKFDRDLFDSKNKNDKDDYKKECLHRFKELARKNEGEIKRSSAESFSEIISLLKRIEGSIRPK